MSSKLLGNYRYQSNTVCLFKISNTIIADTMSFNNAEFKSKTWNFTISKSNLKFPQSDGLFEKNVQTIKRVIRKAKRVMPAYVEFTLLEYRSTSISDMNFKPPQLLMDRQLHFMSNH